MMQTDLETTITPGGWHMVENMEKGNDVQHTIISNDGVVVANIMRRNSLFVGENKFKSANLLHPCRESFANARLMTMAPRLLSALMELVFLHECEQEGISSGMPTAKQWMDAVERAEAVIEETTTF